MRFTSLLLIAISANLAGRLLPWDVLGAGIILLAAVVAFSWLLKSYKHLSRVAAFRITGTLLVVTSSMIFGFILSIGTEGIYLYLSVLLLFCVATYGLRLNRV